jgi:hypothetical protein
MGPLPFGAGDSSVLRRWREIAGIGGLDASPVSRLLQKPTVAALKGLPFGPSSSTSQRRKERACSTWNFWKGLPPVDSSKRLIALRALSIEELQRLYSFRPKISPPDPGQIPQLLRTAQDAQAAFVALFRSRKLLAGTLGFTDFRELLLDVPPEDILGGSLQV